MMLKKVAAFATSLAVAVVVLAGCSAEPESTPVLTSEQIKALAQTAEDNGWTEQADALRDGEVDAAEYADAYDRLSACLTDRGYPSPSTWTSPIDGVSLIIDVDAAGRSDEQKGKDVSECQDRYYSLVQGVYQDTQPYNMDPGIQTKAVECLKAKGYSLNGDESTPAQMAGPNPVNSDGSNSQRWADTITCLQKAQAALFPEIPTAFVTYR